MRQEGTSGDCMKQMFEAQARGSARDGVGLHEPGRGGSDDEAVA
jgi:hypothetical protein